MKLSSSWWVLLGFLAIAGFFLLSEHRAHAFGVIRAEIDRRYGR